MENDRYIHQKKEYNSKLSTFQISNEFKNSKLKNSKIDLKFKIKNL